MSLAPRHHAERGVRTWSVRALLLCALFAGSGCRSSLERGIHHYARGRYAEAERELVRDQPNTGGYDDDERARYALYRGMTHLALGDRDRARAWLELAARVDGDAGGRLSAEDARRLRIARETLASEVER